MPIVIDTEELIGILPYERPSKKIKQYLDAQGLIEPLCLDSAMELGKINWYDLQYFWAAVEAGWNSILITWPGETTND